MGKNFTTAEKAAYKADKQAEQKEMLEQAVDILTSEQGWLNYLRTRTSFRKYSFNNIILIAMQRPSATQVAGAKKWMKDFDRKIIAGERAIRILAPIMVTEKDENGKPVMGENGKPKQRVAFFKGVPVFDVEQTEGPAMPTVEYAPVEGDSHEEYVLRLEAYAEARGYQVMYDDSLGETGGHVNMQTKVITINSARSINSQVRTLIHEIAHTFGYDYTDYTRQQSEVIVESAAYIVTGMIGLDTAGMSVPYIATWGADAEDPKAAMKIMRDFANHIDELVETITEAVA
jgi:antirestriction protein ArdC